MIHAPTKTPKGWHTPVESNEGKSQNFAYVQQIGGKTLLCSVMVTWESDMGGVPEEDAMAACGSIEPGL